MARTAPADSVQWPHPDADRLMSHSRKDLPFKPAEKPGYSKAEILAAADEGLFGPGRPKLPKDNMLMLDRIVKINRDGGSYGRGELRAELDINPQLWFFECHFPGDPVMPGCLGLDAMWQLVGFYLGWLGYPGRGRALGVGEVKFVGQVLPDTRMVTYQINYSRVMARALTVGIADGELLSDGKSIYTAKDLRVGLF